MIAAIEQKIMGLPTLLRTVAGWRLLGERIVFTNGVFDLLHPGHLHYLAEARALAHHLVVGLNSDHSVQQLGKGHDRPIMDEGARALLLASLAYVDAVVLFEEPTPQDLILALRPEVLVKGGDYAIDQIVGAHEVLAWGGEVASLTFHAGYSSTGIIERIRRSS